MAQNAWINITVDANAATKSKREDESHLASYGAAASGDVTFSFDNTKVTNINILNSVLDLVRERARALGIK
jgi:hypothetical protein